MKKKLFGLSGLFFGLAPIVAFAQVTGGSTVSCGSAGGTGVAITTVQGLLCKIGDILSAVVPILIALGVVYFVWGVVSYVIASDEEAKKSGRDRIIYGIIGLAVIIGLWGLVNILKSTFGLSNVQNINFPTTPY